ncbi:hypothetical protein Taro_028393 [Colocasia esculenta]|uniref:Uncharacterized protein n=1 Tax=Colocasia esculenta TaxID=4460 RepID=A0A843VU27_COLES|nr:hypothetical protein [Colocasia esculenta]
MAADYWLAAISLDVDQSWRPPPWTSACGWRSDPWTSMSFTRNTVNVTVELSSFGRPKEEKLKPPSPSAARGCYNNVVKTLPWAQVRPWRSQTNPFISGFLCFLLSQPSQPGSQRGQPATHHRQRETSNVREPP